MQEATRTRHRNVRLKEDTVDYIMEKANKNGLTFSAQLNFMLKQQMNLEIGSNSLVENN